jgi:hypothetical protein
VTGPLDRTDATFRQLRLLALLDGAERIGATPLALRPLHVIAYFADALAPVWGLPIIDGQILKSTSPYFPALQADLDRLVGAGLVSVTEVAYVLEGAHWTLNASYALHREFAERVLEAARSFSHSRAEIKYVHEVVYATSGLGVEGLSAIGAVDATYGDPFVDVGGVIDVERDPGEGENPSAAVALRFGELLRTSGGATTSEMVNLYVRQLYTRLEVA